MVLYKCETASEREPIKDSNVTTTKTSPSTARETSHFALVCQEPNVYHLDNGGGNFLTVFNIKMTLNKISNEMNEVIRYYFSSFNKNTDLFDNDLEIYVWLPSHKFNHFIISYYLTRNNNNFIKSLRQGHNIKLPLLNYIWLLLLAYVILTFPFTINPHFGAQPHAPDPRGCFSCVPGGRLRFLERAYPYRWVSYRLTLERVLASCLN